MAYETIITLDIDPGKIDVPERIMVPNGSKLTFIVNDSSYYHRTNPYDQLRVTVYFEDFMPGFEQRLTVDVPDNPDNDSQIVLANGTVQKPGEYKYGVSIHSGSRRLYDVDPYIIVY